MNIQFLYEFFSILDFLAESLKASKNCRKKITHLTIEFLSKHLSVALRCGSYRKKALVPS